MFSHVPQNKDMFGKIDFPVYLNIFINGAWPVSDQLSRIVIPKDTKYCLKVSYGAYNNEMKQLFRTSAETINILDQIFAFINKHKIKALKVKSITFMDDTWKYFGELIIRDVSLKYLHLSRTIQDIGPPYIPFIPYIERTKLSMFIWDKIVVQRSDYVYITKFKNNYMSRIVMLDFKKDSPWNYKMKYLGNIQLYYNTKNVIRLILLANKKHISLWGLVPRDVLLLILKQLWNNYGD